MSRERWRAVARVDKTHGRHGEIVVITNGSFSAPWRNGLKVAIVPPDNRGRRIYSIASYRGEGAGRLLSLASIDGIGEAQDLVGKTVLMRVSDLPSDWLMGMNDTVAGCMVVDERLGLLGHIVQVLPGGLQGLWKVSGVCGEVLIPIAPEIIIDFDEYNRVAHTRLPVGLAPWDGGSHAD